MKSKLLWILVISLATSVRALAQDPNLYIFLCFGQSNMEGAGKVEAQDRVVDSRFQVFATVDAPNLGRLKDHWYPATAPLCRGATGLSPADYFGRTLVASLPQNIRVGVVNVAVGGCKIELFQTANYKAYSATAPDWMSGIIEKYDGNPYQYLIDAARLAQKDGVIKGVLLHQGESNTNDKQWPVKVKSVYDSLIRDLELKPEMVPLLAGEVVDAEHHGACASMNSIIDLLPNTIPNTVVISSKGLACKPDHLHFTSAAYREFGKRYAEAMLPLLGYKVTDLKDPTSQPTTRPQ